MSAYTNIDGIPLSVAVFLATDYYDYEPGVISATSLIKPVRQTILAGRVPPAEKVVDISSLVKSRMGTAIHDGIEKSWKTNYGNALKSLGYSDEIISRVVINPTTDEELPANAIPVYMEQRVYKEFAGVKLSGKYDFIAEGRLEDFKSTSVYTYLKGTKDSDYQLQGSIYRWLDPHVITQDHMAIQFIFTDWMPGRAAADPKYPKKATHAHLIPLLSLDDTEQYVNSKLTQINRAKNLPEEELPRCSDADLWRSAPAFKYYKNPEKRSRATKNFDNAADAHARKAADGNVGVVVEIPGRAVACRYCAGFALCTQKDELLATGDLEL